MAAITFTLIQTALQWEDKKANLAALEEKILSVKEKTQVVLLPEMFSTGFSMNAEALGETMEGEAVTWMRRIAEKKRVAIAGSLIIKEEDAYYNRLVWMLPNGKMGIYNKRHLFAYAGEHEHYTPGNQRFIASVNGWKINLLVCYDLRFPVWSRQVVARNNEGIAIEPEFDILVYVANWPERRSHAWKTLLQARAIENQCFVIGVNRVGEDGNGIYHSGDSAVINPLGEVLYSKAHDEDVFTITLEKEMLDKVREKLPFWRDADPFLIINPTEEENKDQYS